MTLPRKRRKNSRRAYDSREVPQFRQWVRTFPCVVPGCTEGPIEAAHYDGVVPPKDMGGTGLKRHDKWCFSLCAKHHRWYHQDGVSHFERAYSVNTKALAAEFWATWLRSTKAGQKWQREREAEENGDVLHVG